MLELEMELFSASLFSRVCNTSEHKTFISNYMTFDFFNAVYTVIIWNTWEAVWGFKKNRGFISEAKLNLNSGSATVSLCKIGQNSRLHLDYRMGLILQPH